MKRPPSPNGYVIPDDNKIKNFHEHRKEIDNYVKLRLIDRSFSEVAHNWLFLEKNKEKREQYQATWCVDEKIADIQKISFKDQYYVSSMLQDKIWAWKGQWNAFTSYYLAPDAEVSNYKLKVENLSHLVMKDISLPENALKETLLLELVMLKNSSQLKILTFENLNIDQHFFERLAKILYESSPSIICFGQKFKFQNEWNSQFQEVIKAFFNSKSRTKGSLRRVELSFPTDNNFIYQLYTTYNKNTNKISFLNSGQKFWQIGTQLLNKLNIPEAENFYKESINQKYLDSYFSLVQLYIKNNKNEVALKLLKEANEQQIPLKDLMQSTLEKSIPDVILSYFIHEKEETNDKNKKKINKLLGWMLFNIENLIRSKLDRDNLIKNLYTEKHISTNSIEAIYGKAKEICKILKDQGDIESIILLSRDIGFDSTKEEKEALKESIKFLEKDNKKDISKHCNVQFTLGDLYYRIYKIENSESEKQRCLVQATFYFKNSSNQGHVYAKMMLANMYSQTQNQDVNIILNLYQQSAEMGNSYAHYQLGKIYETGKSGIYSIKVNEAESQEWFERAHKLGNSWASYKLGQEALKNKKYNKAITLFKSRGEANHLESLGYIYTNVESLKDYKNAEKYYEASSKADPNSYSVWKNWGWLKLLQANEAGKGNFLNCKSQLEDELLKKAEEYTLKALSLANEKNKNKLTII